MSSPLVVGAVSIGPADNGPAPCRAAAERALERLAALGAGLAVLPELFDAPYAAALDPASQPIPAEPLDGLRARWAAALAARTGVAIVYGAAVANGAGRPFNAAVLARPDGRVEVVAAKIHLPPAGAGEDFGEVDHFAPGPAEVGTFEVGGVRLAALVCYDRRFPECWRHAAAAGADCVVVPVAGPASADPPALFRAELTTHARANGLYAVAAARFGTETATGRPVRHDGETVAFDPDGRTLAALPPGAAAEILVTVDPAVCRAARAANATAARLRLPAQPAPRRPT